MIGLRNPPLCHCNVGVIRAGIDVGRGSGGNYLSYLIWREIGRKIPKYKKLNGVSLLTMVYLIIIAA